MITKSELQAVHGQMLTERRQRLGAPPTNEELFAYMRGELAPEDQARVRELLIAYPELARAMAEPFPEDGDLSEAELDAHWEALQKRSHGNVVEMRFRRWQRASLALAAALAIAVVSVVLLSVRLRQQSLEPRVMSDAHMLFPDGQRGPEKEAATAITPAGDYQLTVSIINPPPAFTTFRLELTDGSRTLWSSPALARPADDTFRIDMRRAFLAPGKYQVVVYGVNDARQERLASYSLRIEPAAR